MTRSGRHTWLRTGQTMADLVTDGKSTWNRSRYRLDWFVQVACHACRLQRQWTGRLSIASVTDTHGRRECLPTLAIQESLIRQRQSSPVWLEQQADQRAAQARQERERSGGKHRNNASKKRYQAATAAIEKANPQYNFTNPDGLSV